MVWCVDLLKAEESDIREFFKGTDLYYVDPPWSQSIFKWFYTHEQIERPEAAHVNSLYRVIREQIAQGRTAYIEIGAERISEWTAHGYAIAKSWQCWKTRYDNDTRDEWLIRMDIAGVGDVPFSFSGQDSARLPCLAIEHEAGVNQVADLCTGQGCTGRAALSAGKVFRGTELSQNRIEVFLRWCEKAGFAVRRVE